VLRIALFVLILAASLFLAAGRLDWVMGWVYISLLVAGNVVLALVLVSRHPELLADRARSEGPRDLDRILAAIMALWGPMATLVVAGLDCRFGCSSQLSLVVQAGAVVAAALGSALTIWAMASNRHFYGVFRIDRDGGHTVAMAGPYRFVRHPGYAGAILHQLAAPLILGSLWALVPAVLIACANGVRTALEDQRLQKELDGYGAYAQRVRYRLVPGIW
jgi:protein-S-isoprenylcysteine O-methyltransferase Ste14